MILFLAYLPVHAQRISVYAIQNLSFGAFYIGSNGGRVVISTSGSRSVTGDLVALNLGIPYAQAVFEIEAPPGTIISLLNGPDTQLFGSNGGSMVLHIDGSDPRSPFVTGNQTQGQGKPGKKHRRLTQVSVGATLKAGSQTANKPGNYAGTFSIIFNVE